MGNTILTLDLGDFEVNVNKIEDLESLIHRSDNDFTPTTNKKSVVIFDSFNYNSTYLLDVFKNFVENSDNIFIQKIKDIDFYYCDNFKSRVDILSRISIPAWESVNGKISTDVDKIKFESANISPAIMTINGETSNIGINEENILGVMTVEDFYDAINYLLLF